LKNPTRRIVATLCATSCRSDHQIQYAQNIYATSKIVGSGLPRQGGRPAALCSATTPVTFLINAAAVDPPAARACHNTSPEVRHSASPPRFTPRNKLLRAGCRLHRQPTILFWLQPNGCYGIQSAVKCARDSWQRLPGRKQSERQNKANKPAPNPVLRREPVLELAQIVREARARQSRKVCVARPQRRRRRTSQTP
jgi:hypothetical protein